MSTNYEKDGGMNENVQLLIFLFVAVLPRDYHNDLKYSEKSSGMKMYKSWFGPSLQCFNKTRKKGRNTEVASSLQSDVLRQCNSNYRELIRQHELQHHAETSVSICCQKYNLML